MLAGGGPHSPGCTKCGQQERAGDGRHHEAFAPASPVQVGERSVTAAFFFFVSFSAVCPRPLAELAAPRDAAVDERMSATARRKAAGWWSLPTSRTSQSQPSFGRQRAIHKCIFET